MDVSELGIIEIDETPPPLDLTPVEIESTGGDTAPVPCGVCAAVLSPGAGPLGV